MEKKIDFEKALKKLEEITTKLENGNLSLDESLQLFEEGVKLSRVCEKKLLEAENKIIILQSIDNVEEFEKKEILNQSEIREEVNFEIKKDSELSIEEKNKKSKKKVNEKLEQGTLPF